MEELQEGVFENIFIGRYIDLSYNSITKLEPGVFKNITYFGGIYLNNNKLKKIEYGVFSGVKFSTLTVRNNEIAHLEEECFFNIPYTSQIDLRDNKLTKFRLYRFNMNYNLRFIYLEGNSLSTPVKEADFKLEIPNLVSFKCLSPKTC